MPTLRRQILIYVVPLSDLSLLAIALYVSVFERAALTGMFIFAERRIEVHTAVGIAVVLFIWKIALSSLGLYRSRRLDPPLPEIADMLKASAIATLLLLVVSLIFRIHTISPSVLARFMPLTAVSLITSRLVMRQGLKAVRRHGRNIRNLLIVGTNARAVGFANSIVTRPELGYDLVGFVDDAWVGPSPDNAISADLVSDIAGFRSYLRSHVIDEVMITLPIKSFYDREDELLQICREHGVIVRVLTDFFETLAAVSESDGLGFYPLMSFCTIQMDGLGLGAKRLLDIIGSTVLLVLFSPIMFAALLLVRLDSKGPAIFTQERVGLNKRRFRIYKFRSMVEDAEELQQQLESCNELEGPVFKIRQDPRITRVGRILRKTSIDELPQLLNVLKGDMSLVGPRPMAVRDYFGFNKDWQRRRFSVRPGMTCLWQISGRSSISFDQWMHLDMEYIDRWSLWLDLKILARTIPAVLKGSGAA